MKLLESREFQIEFAKLRLRYTIEYICGSANEMCCAMSARIVIVTTAVLMIIDLLDYVALQRSINDELIQYADSVLVESGQDLVV